MEMFFFFLLSKNVTRTMKSYYHVIVPSMVSYNLYSFGIVFGVVIVGGTWRITIERPTVELTIYKGLPDHRWLSVNRLSSVASNIKKSSRQQ